jgi:hypothetical protein
MSRQAGLTDAQLLELDLDNLIAGGLEDRSPDAVRRLFAEGAVAAAVRADAVGAMPRSLTFLAEIVRRGGLAFAAGLPEALPTPQQAQLAQDWIAAAVQAGGGVESAPTFARWLDAVALILDARRSTRSTSP